MVTHWQASFLYSIATEYFVANLILGGLFRLCILLVGLLQGFALLFVTHSGSDGLREGLNLVLDLRLLGVFD